MASIRQEKISNLVKQELAIIFQQQSQTLFNGKFITVTQVRVSPDLTDSKVYLSFMAAKDKEAELAAVKEVGWKVRHLLAQKVGKQLRRIPNLTFFLDDSLDYFDEIERLLK